MVVSRHAWDLSPKEAVQLQRALAPRVRFAALGRAPEMIAGVDVSIRGGFGNAAIVVVRLPDLAVVDRATWHARVTYPYVPGLLSFREMPLLLPAWEQLALRPDVVMVDGHGYAHPRRFGLACHLGLWLETPTFGAAKRVYVGVHGSPRPEQGSHSPLRDPATGELLGSAVRTRARVRPVFVSAGYGITLEEAVALTLATSPRYRIPVPTREAHLLSRQWPEARASEGGPEPDVEGAWG